jgi:hypothetical protein
VPCCSKVLEGEMTTGARGPMASNLPSPLRRLGVSWVDRYRRNPKLPSFTSRSCHFRALFFAPRAHARERPKLAAIPPNLHLLARAMRLVGKLPRRSVISEPIGIPSHLSLPGF